MNYVPAKITKSSLNPNENQFDDLTNIKFPKFLGPIVAVKITGLD